MATGLVPAARGRSPVIGGQAVAARALPELVALWFLIAIAAAVRFVALGHQSYWFDESVTVSIIRHSSVGAVLSKVAASESTPPLYYLLAWGWRHLAGTGELGLRSLSAAVGVGVVPLTWGVTRRLIGWRAGLIAAALVAVNPMLVWYSQEARAYGLLVFLGALSLLFFVRFRERASRANAAGWAAASSLALLTHYFAVFLIAIELVWLLVEMPRDRLRLIKASVPVVVVGLTLVPLAYHQEKAGRTAWIAAEPLRSRIGEIFHELGSANIGLISSASAAPHGPLGPIAIALVVIGLALAGLATTSRERGGAAVLGGVALGTLALALVPIAIGVDFFKDRNLIMIWVPFAGALSAGLATRKPRLVGTVAAAGICGLGLAVDVQVVRDPDLQRQDWRGVARVMGAPKQTRAVVVVPGYATTPLEVYGHHLGRAAPGMRVSQLVLAGQLPAKLPPQLGRNGPHLDQLVALGGGLRLARYETGRAFTLTSALFRQSSSPVLVEPGPRLAAWDRTFFAQFGRWERLAAFLRRSSHPPLALTTPVAPPARLLSLPPELAGLARLRSALQRTFAAAASLNASLPPAAGSSARFRLALSALINAP